jgi:DNA processing protein
MKDKQGCAMEDPDVYKIALSLVPGIGGITARKILACTGSAEAMFSAPEKTLLGIPGVGELLAERIRNTGVLDQARRELEFINKGEITCLFYGEDAYPERLLDCYDAPMLLYRRGQVNLNGRRMISIVGTRRPGSYGMDMCKCLVRDLASLSRDLVIVSGLAYGIDHCAHKSAMENGLDTVAVLGHGLKYMYPALHRHVAEKISLQGALLTDFASDQKPERNNFIRRNRIVAGLSDVTIVVQSGQKGGALITADIANSYHRDVFTFPGRVGDPASAGCNQLIKTHKAALIEGAGDVAYLLGWDTDLPAEKKTQGKLIHGLSDKEAQIMKILRSEGHVSIDRICLKSSVPVSRISGILLNLELAGLIKCLPGDVYCAEN